MHNRSEDAGLKVTVMIKSKDSHKGETLFQKITKFYEKSDSVESLRKRGILYLYKQVTMHSQYLE